MTTFTVNGRTVSVEKNQKLLRYLRDTASDQRQGRSIARAAAALVRYS